MDLVETILARLGLDNEKRAWFIASYRAQTHGLYDADASEVFRFGIVPVPLDIVSQARYVVEQLCGWDDMHDVHNASLLDTETGLDENYVADLRAFAEAVWAAVKEEEGHDA